MEQEALRRTLQAKAAVASRPTEAEAGRNRTSSDLTNIRRSKRLCVLREEADVDENSSSSELSEGKPENLPVDLIDIEMDNNLSNGAPPPAPLVTAVTPAGPGGANAGLTAIQILNKLASNTARWDSETTAAVDKVLKARDCQALYRDYRSCINNLAQLAIALQVVDTYKQAAELFKGRMSQLGWDAEDLYYRETGQRPQAILEILRTANTKTTVHNNPA